MFSLVFEPQKEKMDVPGRRRREKKEIGNSRKETIIEPLFMGIWATDDGYQDRSKCLILILWLLRWR